MHKSLNKSRKNRNKKAKLCPRKTKFRKIMSCRISYGDFWTILNMKSTESSGGWIQLNRKLKIHSCMLGLIHNNFTVRKEKKQNKMKVKKTKNNKMKNKTIIWTVFIPTLSNKQEGDSQNKAGMQVLYQIRSLKSVEDNWQKRRKAENKHYIN